MDLSNLMGTVGGAPLKSEMDLPKGVSSPNIESNKRGLFERHLQDAGKEANISKEPKSDDEAGLNKPAENVESHDDKAASDVASSKLNQTDKDKSVEQANSSAEESTEVAQNASVQSQAANTKGLEKIAPEEIDQISQDLDQIISQFLNDSGMSFEDLKAKIAQTGELPKELQDKISELENKIGSDLQEKDIPLNLASFVQDFISKLNEAKSANINEIAKLPSLSKELQKFIEIQKQNMQENSQDPSLIAQKENLALKPKAVDPRMDQLIRQMSNVHQKMMDTKTLAKSQSMSASKAKELFESSAGNNKIAFKEDVAVQKPGRLKDLADSLFIQRSLQQPSPDSQINFLNGKLATASEPSQLGFAQSVRANLVEDIQAQFQKMMITKDGGQISLKLRPGNLGELKIDLHVVDKSVRLVMETEKSAAQGILKSQISELKHSLHQAGLKVDDIQINTLRSNDTNQHQNQGQQKDQQWNQQNQQHRQQNQPDAHSDFVAGFEDQLAADRSAA